MAKDTRKTDNRPADQQRGDDDVQKVAIVPNPDAAEAGPVGPVLTRGQAAGLDPLDPARDAEQAQHRNDLINRQTDHERENSLDPTSGGPSPGVTDNTPLTAKQQGSPVTDMSGRPPLTDDDKALMPKVRDGLRKARDDDKDNDQVPDNMKGWRTPAELGIPGASMKRMAENGAPLETMTVPNGHFFPESGTRYRLK